MPLLVSDGETVVVCERDSVAVTEALLERVPEAVPQWDIVTTLVVLRKGVPVTESDEVTDEVCESLADRKTVALADAVSESIVVMDTLMLEDAQAL